MAEQKPETSSDSCTSQNEDGSGDGSKHCEQLSDLGSGKLDLEFLTTCLMNCITCDGDVIMDEYIKTYRELNRFFELLGTVFHFVAKDVNSKLNILEEYRKSEMSVHFQTVQSMVKYEEHRKLQRQTNPPSGSRTLLRLHRALAFIVEFLGQVNQAKSDDRVASNAQDAYNNTLAKYHPWLIRQTANVAMYALPTKRQLMKQTCAQQDETLISQLVPRVIELAKGIYNKVQTVYETNEILDLP